MFYTHLQTKVFEINEYMENIVGDQSKILELLESLQNSADKYSHDFKNSLLEEDRDKAIKAAVHLKYFYKVFALLFSSTFSLSIICSKY